MIKIKITGRGRYLVPFLRLYLIIDSFYFLIINLFSAIKLIIDILKIQNLNIDSNVVRYYIYNNRPLHL